VSSDVLVLEGIYKDYGNVRALNDITMSVQAGEVVGVVGDNGAGKSTLVKIITGFHRPSGGVMRLAGEDVDYSSPTEARRKGIEAVYQDLALIDEISLWRNFFLGKELVRKFGPLRKLDTKTMRRMCAKELSELGLTRLRGPDEPASILSGGERQSLAITRAVHFGAKVLLLDEPTAALSVRETRKVFSTIEAVKARGLGVIYIDHNMSHVHPIADKIVFIEHGRVERTLHRGEASIEDLNDLVARFPVPEQPSAWPAE